MKIAREGIPLILVGLILAAAAWAGVALRGGPALVTVAGLLSVGALFTVYFFRDPDPTVPVEPGVVLAPGQGRILDIRDVEEDTFFHGVCRRITIFLSVFDVHVQRAPLSGTVTHREYRPGAYMVAWREKASRDNERASLGLVTPWGKVMVRQIAGLVARRIVTYPTEGDRVERGERIGLIRFGSRVDLFVPVEWEVTCRVGDRAVTGVTVLARHPTEIVEELG